MEARTGIKQEWLTQIGQIKKEWDEREARSTALDKNYTDFENSIGQFGNSVRIRARIARAVKELRKAIEK